MQKHTTDRLADFDKHKIISGDNLFHRWQCQVDLSYTGIVSGIF